MKIYLASPFSNEAQILNIRLTIDKLRKSGYKVFAPCEVKIKKAKNNNEVNWENRIFIRDIKEINECDIVLGINYETDDDLRTSWELNHAAIEGKKIYLIRKKDNPVNVTMPKWINGYIYIEDFINKQIGS